MSIPHPRTTAEDCAPGLGRYPLPPLRPVQLLLLTLLLVSLRVNILYNAHADVYSKHVRTYVHIIPHSSMCTFSGLARDPSAAPRLFYTDMRAAHKRIFAL